MEVFVRRGAVGFFGASLSLPDLSLGKILPRMDRTPITAPTKPVAKTINATPMTAATSFIEPEMRANQIVPAKESKNNTQRKITIIEASPLGPRLSVQASVSCAASARLGPLRF